MDQLAENAGTPAPEGSSDGPRRPVKNSKQKIGHEILVISSDEEALGTEHLDEEDVVTPALRGSSIQRPHPIMNPKKRKATEMAHDSCEISLDGEVMDTDRLDGLRVDLLREFKFQKRNQGAETFGKLKTDDLEEADTIQSTGIEGSCTMEFDKVSAPSRSTSPMPTPSEAATDSSLRRSRRK
ncbi:uncharacterized protein BDZ99DRAFT_482428 [Mytilinidion resinicola]|uniref:Uncharacterized protein n=1 Tax=Mytilinidion resinicola TaxID=574789 RepID=A0A6A6Y2I3_9PEZI|nr:uncharacterized protein BDZ99DRAFT_482428 [Mytilinidion resinicola]KAF2802849.1 hypothetical protein BDZ99DRAFT_482428 [Mytilinidion resinicola]